jgi:hypothetical protein
LYVLLVYYKGIYFNGIFQIFDVAVVRNFFRMPANDPAVEGVNVTRRSIRSRSRYFRQKAVTVQGGYGAIFAPVPIAPDSYRDGSYRDRRKTNLSQWLDLSGAEVTNIKNDCIVICQDKAV